MYSDAAAHPAKSETATTAALYRSEPLNMCTLYLQRVHFFCTESIFHSSLYLYRCSYPRVEKCVSFVDFSCLMQLQCCQQIVWDRAQLNPPIFWAPLLFWVYLAPWWYCQTSLTLKHCQPFSESVASLRQGCVYWSVVSSALLLYGGFYTSSGFGSELGDNLMILVFDTASGLHYYWW
jgi:hypothetical protein